MDYFPLFIERLQELMADRNLNRYNLAKLLNCDDQSIANWFAQKYYPSVKNLLSMSEYFNCSIDFILGLSDNEKLVLSKQPSAFKERYIICRDKSKLTDYRIAKLCGIGQATISQWLNNDRHPEPGTIVKLANIFDCSFEYLLGREH